MNRDTLWGALWMAVAACCFVTMGVAARELHLSGMNTPNIMVWRSGFGLILTTVLILLTGHISQFRTQQKRGHLVRNSVHFVGQFSWFYALGYLPLVLVTTKASHLLQLRLCRCRPVIYRKTRAMRPTVPLPAESSLC